MNSLVNSTLWATFILSIFCERSESYTLNHNIPANPDSRTAIRLIRQTPVQACKDDVSKFQCVSSIDCINPELKCDGKEDCPDGSDEKLSLCQDFPCVGSVFRCDYGACINSNARCDGKKDCNDNSDEINCEVPDKIDINCRSDQYECDNGQCIEIDGKCNGAAECDDKSDETEELCFNIFCPEHTFKCKYGACVNGAARCNKVQDCIDNSDEDEKTCSNRTPDVPEPRARCYPKQCTAPVQPANGELIVISTGEKCHDNSLIDANTVIKYTCNPGYKLSTTTESSLSVQCLPTGKWSVTVLPTCQKLCTSLYNSDLITLKCKNDGSSVPCDKATDNTILTYKCAPYYEQPHGTPRSSTCYDGSWDYIPDCIPVCGEKIVSATPLIVNGHEVKRGHYPWVVALYSKKDTGTSFINICSGTLITTQVVLTAAHCVTGESGQIYNAKHFRIGAGKYYNNYEDPRDNDTAQYAEIALIETHMEYKGEIQNFRGDIALLKLETNLVLSKAVQPACYNELSAIEPNTYGVIAGWGYTISSGEPSETLKELELPYIGHEECSKNFDRGFSERYVTPDKLCAGFNNQNSSVCKGDSGGGMVFINPYLNRYFIHGIVSLGHPYLENQKVHCNIQQSALLTNLDTYIEWIQLKIQFWFLQEKVHRLAILDFSLNTRKLKNEPLFSPSWKTLYIPLGIYTHKCKNQTTKS